MSACGFRKVKVVQSTAQTSNNHPGNLKAKLDVSPFGFFQIDSLCIQAMFVEATGHGAQVQTHQI